MTPDEILTYRTTPPGPTGTDLRRAALREVEGCVCKDRQNQYGDAEDNFAVIAEFWTTYLRCAGLLAPGRVIAPHVVAALSGLIKTARKAHNPLYRDNWIDEAGYAVCGAGIVAREKLVSEAVLSAQVDALEAVRDSTADIESLIAQSKQMETNAP